MSRGLGTIGDVLKANKAKVLNSLLGINVEKPVKPKREPTPLIVKHRHNCRLGGHKWTVFTTVPACPHKGELKVCPVDVNCPSHQQPNVGEHQQ